MRRGVPPSAAVPLWIPPQFQSASDQLQIEFYSLFILFSFLAVKHATYELIYVQFIVCRSVSSNLTEYCARF